MQSLRITAILLGIALLVPAASALAQTQRSGGGESQKILQQYQQLAAEKTGLQAQLAQMKKDLDAAQAELASVRKERDALQGRSAAAAAAQLAQANSGREAAEKALEQSRQRLTEIVERFRETAGNLKSAEASAAQLQRRLDEQKAGLDRCAEDNLQLFEITNQVLDRYDHVGLFTRISAEEPFTRITRTRIGNLVDEYRERALELRAKKPAP
jgi:chromosome segregation ATPase